MQSVPRLSGGGIAEGIPGRIPDYLQPPAGCRFHPRCPQVMAVCRQEKPPAYEVSQGHHVACFLYDQNRPAAAAGDAQRFTETVN
jgi:peptide/nickel transport system ATP-binding protein